MSSSRINKIIYDETSIRPILGNFQNGVIQPSKEDKLSCALYTDKRTNMHAVIASEKGFYKGEIERNKNCYNNFVLIRNKKKGTCKLIAVDKVTFDFSLQASVKSPHKDDENELNKPTVADLVKHFGSKKQRKYREQQEKMQLDVETMKEQFEQVVDETHIDQADLEPAKPEDTETAYKPPINRAAKREEEIYPLEDLISMDILSELEEEAKSLLFVEDFDNLNLSEFVKNRILKLQKSSSSERELKAQILLYIEYLINYIKVPAKSIGSRKYQPCLYSQKLSEHIFRQFSISTSSGKTRPMSMRDKCICYILVFAMIACNLTLNLEELSKDLKLGIKRLQDLSRVLCFTINPKDKSVVTLKLPLPPPPSNAGPNKRKR